MSENDGIILDDLPEGTLLYEESSVRRVSQVIRSISGTDEKFSHRMQPDAIRALKNKLSPTFMFGPAGLYGGVSGWHATASAGITTFPNIWYMAHESEKNVIVTASFDYTNRGSEDGAYHGGRNLMNFIFSFFGKTYQTYANMPSINITCSTEKDVTVGDNVGVRWSNMPENTYLFKFKYDPGDELKFIGDTKYSILYIYVNDVLIDSVDFSQNTHIYDIIPRHNGDTLYGICDGYFDMWAGPLSYSTSDPSNMNCRSKINYLRITMEDWE